MATHIFSAMRPFHHRDPGLSGWALTTDGVSLGVIADAQHCDPIALKIVRKCAEDRTVLVSDASVGAAAEAGDYVQAGRKVTRDQSGRVVDSDGTLAGSGMTLDRIAATWQESTGASPAATLLAATERPAELIGLNGVLEVGAIADIALFSDDLEVRGVFKNGRQVR